MFYIYSILLFFLASLGCLAGKQIAPTDNWESAALVFQIIFTTVSVIFFIAGFFHQLTHTHELKRSVIEYRRCKKEIAQEEEKLGHLKKYYEDYLAKLYPEMERDIFSKIAENQPKELAALFQQYPDLKASVVLKKLTKQVAALYNNLYDAKRSFDYRVQHIQNSKTNPWILWTQKLPADIEKEISL